MTTFTETDVAPRLLPTLTVALRALGASAGGASASRLLGLLYDPDVDVDRILQCLRSEPVLAARVLKVANAPYYGRSGQVGSVERAVQLLGLQAIRGIAAAGALDRMTPGKSGRHFDPLRFRRHSAAVASAAQSLSRQARCGVDGEAFIAGLMHDIGVLLLVKADGQAMASFDPPETTDQAQARAAEQAHFGLDHEAAGALIIDSWALPAWLKEAVAGHHGPIAEALAPGSRSGLQALPDLLRLADRVAAAAGFGLWPRCEGPLDAAALAVLDLNPDDVHALVQTLPEAVDALAPGG
jgi:HD-like signal output (HDOD) protein